MNLPELNAECAWAREALFAEREAALAVDGAARLAVHLACCHSCGRQQLWDARLTHALQAPVPAVSLEVVVKRRVRRRRLVGLAGLTSVAAGILVAISVTLLSLRATPHTAPVAANGDKDVTRGLWTALEPVDLELADVTRRQTALENVIARYVKEF